MRFLPDLLTLRSHAEETAATLPGLMIQAEKLADTILHGDHPKRKAGMGEKFWQYREYVTGDRPQDIDWRQSAKSDQVFVKQKEWQITRQTFFWCARGQSMAYRASNERPRKADYAAILVIGLAILLQKSKEHIGLLSEMRTGRSDAMIEKIGRTVLEQTEDPLPNSAEVSLPKNAYFIGAGDFLSPIEEIAASFHHLFGRTENALILQILDPAELSLTYDGRVKFQTMDHSESHVIQNVSSVRDAYEAKIQAHCRAIQHICEQQGWTYKLCVTDQPLHSVLHELYAQLDGGV